ncbi:MAG: amidase [Clostridiaceae bacterium]|nr:amidase [Clostridiaceae bacterium]
MSRIKYCFIILLVVIFVFPSNMVKAKAITTVSQDVNMSTWIWDTAKISKDSDKIIKFLVSNKVKTVYLQIDTSLGNKIYREFIQKAMKNNINIYALDGSSEWVGSKGVQLQENFFAWFTQYQKSSSKNQLFKGVHLDVEPYLNSNYNVNPNLVIENYQQYLIKSKEKCTTLGVEFSIDIPFWFDKVNYVTKYGKGNVAEWICKNIKAVTIMAYRDKALGDNGIIKISEAEINLCKKYNVKVTLGVETNKIAGDASLTFYEEGKAYMLNELNTVSLKYKNNSAFEGLAIHYIDSWMNLKK